jgi:hypothetical protein
MRRKRLLIVAAVAAVPAAVSVAAALADPRGTARVLLRRVAP